MGERRWDMELEELYQRSAEEFAKRLQRVPAHAWGETTRCCPNWTVHDLVNHVVNEFRWIPPLLAGLTIEDVGDSLDGDLLGDDPLHAWRRAADEALAAVQEPGAGTRTVHLSSGPAPARGYLSEVLSDQIIHTWDLASSIGVDEALDSELLDFAERTLEPLVETWRAAGAFSDPVEVLPDADPQTKLLALLGRQA